MWCKLRIFFRLIFSERALLSKNLSTRNIAQIITLWRLSRVLFFSCHLIIKSLIILADSFLIHSQINRTRILVTNFHYWWCDTQTFPKTRQESGLLGFKIIVVVALTMPPGETCTILRHHNHRFSSQWKIDFMCLNLNRLLVLRRTNKHLCHVILHVPKLHISERPHINDFQKML